MAMNHTEMLSALSVHALRNRNDAAEQRKTAVKVKDDADTYARQHIGPGMDQKRRDIWGEGVRQADVHLAAAAAADERASTAEQGYFLSRPDLESRDPSWCTEHQDLTLAAVQHGVMTDTPM